MNLFTMAAVTDKSKLVQFVLETGSIITAQRRSRCEFNKSPPHRNLIRKWVKQFSEVGDVKKRKSPGRPKVSNQRVDDVRAAMLLSHTFVYQKVISTVCKFRSPQFMGFYTRD